MSTGFPPARDKSAGQPICTAIAARRVASRACPGMELSRGKDAMSDGKEFDHTLSHTPGYACSSSISRGNFCANSPLSTRSAGSTRIFPLTPHQGRM